MGNSARFTRRRAITVASVGIVACYEASFAQQIPRPAPRWTSRPPLPFAVQEIYPAGHKGKIHIAGGLLGEGGRVVGVSNRHIAYDPATGKSAALAVLPAHRHHPHAVDHKGKLYLAGGFGSDPDRVTWIMTAETLLYDDAANNWSSLAPAPEPHAEVVATSLGDRIHIAGGRRPKGTANSAYGDHDDVDRHLVFDPGATAWSKAAPALSKRNSAAGAVIGGLWHVVGGRSVADGPTDAHEVYDPKEDRWRNAAPMPKGSGAGGNAAAAVTGKLYVFGGEYFDNGGLVHPEVWAYDPKTDSWTGTAPMPTPRHGLGAVALNNEIWLVGGAKKPSGTDTSDVVESFAPGG
ncbi:MAG TPA: kelch repeat-containing protein [Hyphomonadaceae bacterium]|nr:kelch repeat-containing protein [Hyphomonadaceae bacterium]